MIQQQRDADRERAFRALYEAMSAWRIQRLTDSTEMSEADATSACVRSPRRATRTTSHLNSGGNSLGTATSFQQDLVPQMECPPILQQSHVIPAVTIVTDNGGPFRSFRFEALIPAHPELHHVRTRVRTPGQNGSRGRGFQSLKYERFFLEEIDDVLALVAHADDYRTECNTEVFSPG